MDFIRVLLLGFLASAGSGNVFSQSESHAPASIAEVVVFGDSLSDIGNVFVTTGLPTPPYFEGRFSNGPIWAEYLAAHLGVPALTASLTGGANYAYASAETGLGLAPVGVPNIRSQIATFLAGNSVQPDQLFAVWGGGNDFFNGETDPAVPVGNLAAAVTTLADAGARMFVVPNLTPLGFTPLFQQRDMEAQQIINAITLEFNRQLAAAMRSLEDARGIQIYYLDVSGLGEKVAFDPERFGFTNLTRGAVGDGVLDGAGYLFWDDVHPTTAAHALIGNAAFELIRAEAATNEP